jgi:hypothetical protein
MNTHLELPVNAKAPIIVVANNLGWAAMTKMRLG